MIDAATSKPNAERARKMARQPSSDDKPQEPKIASGSAAAEPTPPKPPSKTSAILGMLQREGGTTLAEMVEVTGWLPHTTRAALTGIRKKGHDVTRTKVDGETRYAIAAAPSQ